MSRLQRRTKEIELDFGEVEAIAMFSSTYFNAHFEEVHEERLRVFEKEIEFVSSSRPLLLLCLSHSRANV